MKRTAAVLTLAAAMALCSSCELEKHDTTTTEINAGGDVTIMDGEGNVIDQFTSTNAAAVAVEEEQGE